MPQETTKRKPYLVFDDEKAYGLVDTPYKKVGFNDLMVPQNELDETLIIGVVPSTILPPGLSSPLTTKGDIWGYSTTDARIPVSSINDDVLTSDSSQSLGVRWAGARWLPNRQRYYARWAPRYDATSVGLIAVMNGGITMNQVHTTATRLMDATGQYINYNAPGINSSAGINTAHLLLPRIVKPIYLWTVKTGAGVNDLSNTRIWVAITDVITTQIGSDTPATSYAGFRYSTGAGDTTWNCMVDDGSGTPAATSSGVTMALDTRYELMVDCTETSSIKFYVNRSLVATHTTKLITNTTQPEMLCQMRTSAVADRAENLRVGLFHIDWD